MGRKRIGNSRTVLPNGNIKLFSENGILDIRTKQTFREVVCKPNHEKFFSFVE